MSFLDNVVDEVVRVAKKNGIEPAAMMAVVECESSGNPLEADGVTPRFLYERHVMYKELKAKRGQAKATEAVRLGLARIGWDRSTQYKDQGSSQGRLALIKKARAFDEECANRSASWGVGQTMGFHAESQGFKNANEMVQYMVDGGIPAQVQCMVNEIKKSGLIDEMNRHDWAGFARRYNGAGYAQNKYDTRMAAAYVRWKKKLAGYTPKVVEAKNVDTDDDTLGTLAKVEVQPQGKDSGASLRQAGIVATGAVGFLGSIEFKMFCAIVVVAIAGYAFWNAQGRPKFWVKEYWN